MPYPRYVDDRANLAGRLGARGLPATVFYDADGKQEYVHQGAYPTEAKLSADIEKYTLRLMIEVREARDDAERAAAMAIRHTVFVDEQDVPVELEVDGLDDGAVHLVAVRDGTVVGDLPPDRPRRDGPARPARGRRVRAPPGDRRDAGPGRRRVGRARTAPTASCSARRRTPRTSTSPPATSRSASPSSRPGSSTWTWRIDAWLRSASTRSPALRAIVAGSAPAARTRA